MRSALVLPFLVTSVLLACSTFTNADDPPQTPPVEAGTDAIDNGTCTPVVVDPAAPQTCNANLSTDPVNCGTCGHACVEAKCELGRCVPEVLAPNQVPVAASDDGMLYGVIGTDIQRADLRLAPPLTFEQLPSIVSITGIARRLEVYNGELYVSTDQVQTIVTPSDGKQRGNELAARANAATGDGVFFPGATAYYTFPNGGAQRLARIDPAGSVDFKDKPSFLPAVRSGNELFWTEPLKEGAKIWGRWGELENPIARVGHDVLAFGADGEDVFYAHAPSLSRASKGQGVELAKESGDGIGFVVRGNDLFYAVRRSTAIDVRYAVLRVDKCKGGRPVELLDTASEIYAIFSVDADHLVVTTSTGILRIRR